MENNHMTTCNVCELLTNYNYLKLMVDKNCTIPYFPTITVECPVRV